MSANTTTYLELVPRADGSAARSGPPALRMIREELHATRTVRRLSGTDRPVPRTSPLTQDALISNMKYVLAKTGPAEWLTSTAIARDDRRAVDALYRRVFGNDAAEASRLRWDWQYRRNPNNPGQEPADLDRPRRPAPSSGSTRRCR